MKNRKNTFVLAIVALILVLGVGYAIVTASNLTINGNASAKSDTLKVVYDGVNTPTATADCTGVNNCVSAIQAVDDSREATFTIENMTLNQPVTVTFEIKNKETDVNASVGVPTVNLSNSTYFSYDIKYDNAAWTAAKTLNAQATAVVSVTMTLIKTPVNTGDDTTTVSVAYSATPIAS